MKYIIPYLLLTSIFLRCNTIKTNNFYIPTKYFNKKILRSKLLMHSETKLYTTGGITFTYPPCLFSSPPIIQVTEEISFSNPNPSYIIEVVSNTTTETLVMVYQVQTINGIPSVTEIPNGSVSISLIAQENII